MYIANKHNYNIKKTKMYIVAKKLLLIVQDGG